MNTIMNELFETYNAFTPDTEVEKEIEDAHQSLIRSLEKPERKLVLRIIDGKDTIKRAYAGDSFECGFWLAWRLLTQLNNYDNGRLLEQEFNAGGRFTTQREENDNG